jgi:hypothetical protein
MTHLAIGIIAACVTFGALCGMYLIAVNAINDLGQED